MSETVEWTYWAKLPEVKVFEALALLEGIEPEAAPPDIEGATPQYRKTLRLLLACLSDRSFFSPGTLNTGDPALHEVRLREVGKWAVAHGYTLPAKFPRPVQVPKAPTPIVPLRGSSFAPSRKPSPANWSKWKHIPKCPLWKAICLTLDIEPDEDKHHMRNWLRDCRGTPHGLPAEFADRLEVARENVSTNGPIQPQRMYVGVLRNPYGEVLLSEVAAAAISWDWPLPEPMRALAIPATPSNGAGSVVPETREQRQDRRLQACVTAGLPMDDKSTLLRLPDGVALVADAEGVSRQTFSIDVKAALERRAKAKREGGR